MFDVECLGYKRSAINVSAALPNPSLERSAKRQRRLVPVAHCAPAPRSALSLGRSSRTEAPYSCGGSMTEIERLKHLKLALRIVGVIAIFGFYPLTVFWPSGWAWSSGRSEYLEMIIAIYATLGVFLLIAARNPNQHLGLVSFAIWSSIVHGAVMAVQSVQNPMHVHHLYGDVPALFIIAAVLAFLSPQAFRLPFAKRAA